MGLKFDGTLTNVKNKTKLYSFSFEYKHQSWAGPEYTDLDWEGDFVGDYCDGSRKRLRVFPTWPALDNVDFGGDVYMDHHNHDHHVHHASSGKTY